VLSPAPYTPYPKVTHPPPKNPEYKPQVWQKANRDDFDIATDTLRDSLKDVARGIADSVWQEFLLWLASYRANSEFDQTSAIPIMEAHFNKLLKDTETSAAADNTLEADINKKTRNLADIVAHIDAIHTTLNNSHPPLDFNPVALNKELGELHPQAAVLERSLNELETTTEPPLTVIDEVMTFWDGQLYIPVTDVPSNPDRLASLSEDWKETNYKRFNERTALFFPPVTQKFPLEVLLMQMEQPASSKLLLPCPLELYSVDELKKAKKDHTASDWLNRFADPVEPLKCWSVEEFQKVYSSPGFHFLIARVAHMGPQSRDAKLPALRGMLSARWDMKVVFETIPPQQDWMLCTIPSKDGLVPDSKSTEILNTSLICMVEGNTSYIVRHIAPTSVVRDLEFTITNSSTNDKQVFNQLKK